MTFTILSQEEQPLFKRTVHVVTSSFDKATPSRKEIRDSLAKQLKTNVDCLVIRSVKTNYGEHELRVEAAAYKVAQDAVYGEPKSLLKKHVVAKEEPVKKEAEKPAEEKAVAKEPAPVKDAVPEEKAAPEEKGSE